MTGENKKVSLERLIFLHHKNYVAQHHTRYSLTTDQIINDFNIKPIVLVRNIFDVIESVFDHCHKEGVTMPMAYVPDDFLKWDGDIARNFIGQMIVPWYFNFYVSWYHYDKKILITYENMIKNPIDILAEIVDYTGISTQRKDIENSVLKSTKQSTRKNIGKAGRGKNVSTEIKEKN